MNKPKYKAGDIVITLSMGYRMRVVSSEEHLKGHRYMLRFMTKFGFDDKRRTPRYFYESDLSKPTN